jgi:acetyl esterase
VSSPRDLGLAPAILDWATRMEEVAREIPDLRCPYGPRRRAAAAKLSDALATWSTAEAPGTVAISDHQVEGPGGTMLLRRYRPEGLPDRAPTQLFLHGGGFHAGSVHEVLNDRLCARRAQDAGIQLYSLDYRLAPEHRYPAAVLDTLAAFRVLADDPRFGVDSERLGLGGNSAGAAIAASTALAACGRNSSTIRHLDLEVVPGALAPIGDSAQRYSSGFGLDDAAALVEIYVGPGEIPVGASPLDVAALTGLPPTLIIVAEYDPLRDSGLALARRLRDAKVQVRVLRGLGQLHGTLGLTAILPAAVRLQSAHSLALAAAYSTPMAPDNMSLEGDDDVA